MADLGHTTVLNHSEGLNCSKALKTFPIGSGHYWLTNIGAKERLGIISVGLELRIEIRWVCQFRLVLHLWVGKLTVGQLPFGETTRRF